MNTPIALILTLCMAGNDPEFLPLNLEQDPKPAAAPAKPWREFEMVTGVMFSNTTSSFQATRGNGGAGLAIDAEGVLGLDRDILSPYLWLAWRPAEHHRIAFGFQDLSRKAERTLDREIEFDGNTYTIGTTVDSIYGLQFFGVDYAWSFLQDDRMDIALTFGFKTLRAHFSIEEENNAIVGDVRYIFPVPLPGLFADFALTPDLWLRERLQMMYVPIENYSGLMIHWNISVEYSLLENVSLGVGFDLLRVNLKKQSTGDTFGDFNGDFRFNSAGAVLYINFHL